MQLTEDRYCPVCGRAEMWSFGLVWHVVNGAKYVHVKIRNEFREGRVKLMASILKNGLRYLDMGE